MDISSVSGFSSLQSLFSRIDANADGKVTKDEFLSTRPGGVSESQASALFDKIDSTGSGALTESQLTQGMAANKPSGDPANLQSKLSSDVLAALFQIIQGTSDGASTATASTAAAGSQPPSASERYAQMDTDGDGKVSKDEFLAARPKGVSEDQALALYNSIDTTGTGSITLAQFEGSAPKGAGGGEPPHGHHHHGGGGGGLAVSKTFDALDTNQDGTVSLQELLAAKPATASIEQATNLFTKIDTDNSGGVSLDEFKAALAHKGNTASTASATSSSSVTTANNDAAEEAYLQAMLKAVSAYNTSTNATRTASVLASA